MCKKTVEPYIIRNGGWVTPQLDNILEKARLDQLRGQLLELQGKSKKRKTPKRYTVYVYCRGSGNDKGDLNFKYSDKPRLVSADKFTLNLRKT